MVIVAGYLEDQQSNFEKMASDSPSMRYAPTTQDYSAHVWGIGMVIRTRGENPYIYIYIYIYTYLYGRTDNNTTINKYIYIDWPILIGPDARMHV